MFSLKNTCISIIQINKKYEEKLTLEYYIGYVYLQYHNNKLFRYQ